MTLPWLCAWHHSLALPARGSDLIDEHERLHELGGQHPRATAHPARSAELPSRSPYQSSSAAAAADGAARSLPFLAIFCDATRSTLVHGQMERHENRTRTIIDCKYSKISAPPKAYDNNAGTGLQHRPVSSHKRHTSTGGLIITAEVKAPQPCHAPLQRHQPTWALEQWQHQRAEASSSR